jgi:uncharacterized protein (TIGR03790 family)
MGGIMFLNSNKSSVLKASIIAIITTTSPLSHAATTYDTIAIESAASGTGTAPIMKVLINGIAVPGASAKTISNLAYQTFTFNTAGKSAPGSKLDIVFSTTSTTSRSLLIRSIKVNGTTIPFASGRYDIGIGSAAFDGINVKPITSTNMTSQGAWRFTLSSGLTAAQMGLVINDNDPYSVTIGEYYRVKRNIPPANIVHVKIPVTNTLTADQFAPFKKQIDAALPSYVQGIALAWEKPYAVSCNSITSAVTMGFQPNMCSDTCGSGTFSPYYGTTDTLPFTQRGIRPSMLLAAKDVAGAKALIDRGLASNHKNPTGSAYIMSTSDSIRSIRARLYPSAYLGKILSPNVNVSIVKANSISQKTDSLFYFQGLVSVPNLTTNKYPAGAIADTLTSYSGRLNDPLGQMSILDFISAGVTGSFGTVTEPCANDDKFPNPAIVIRNYTAGRSLLESYWKSVKFPFQGLFIGDPLANPWESSQLNFKDTLKPTAPTYLTGYYIAGTDIDSIYLSWGSSQDDVGIKGYKLYRNGKFFIQISDTAITDSSVSYGSTYTYSVSAVDAGGNESAQSNTFSVIAKPYTGGGTGTTVPSFK